MESDYGWSAIEDDTEEEYSGHDVTDAADSSYETFPTVENDDPHLFEIKSEKVNASSLTRSQKALGGKKNGVKRKRRRLTGAEEFFQLILSWNIEKLQLNNRKDIGLAPLAEMPSYFSNGLLYYDTMRQVAVEEARACLSQGLMINLGKMELKLSKVDDSMEDGQLVLIIFRILKGGLELTRPGSVFKLHSSSGNSYKSGYPESQGGSNQKTPSNSSKRSSPVSNMNTAAQNAVETTLAVVAQGSQAMKLAAALGGFSTAIPLWVHSSSPLGKRLISNADDYDGTHWTAVSIGSVLSYQRMASVCSDSPCPPFMNKLLGHRPISHIKFDSDSDSDGDSEVDMKSDQVKKKQSPIVDDRSFDDIEEVSFDSCDDTDSVSSDDSDEPEGFMAHLSAKSSNKIKTLNESQRVALHACLGGEGSDAGSATQTLRMHTGNLHLILGPPGCGKTHFLVAMLHALIARSTFSSTHGDNINGDGNDGGDRSVKTRIMVCAPSNKAVCVVLEQFLQSGVVGGTMSKGKSKSKDKEKELGWVRCALIGVMDKLEGCSSNVPTPQCEVTLPRPLLPAAVTDLTQRFLHPYCAADVFVSTYAKGISDALSAVMHYLMEAVSPHMVILSDRAKLAAPSHSSVVEVRGSILHLQAVLRSLHSEMLSLMRLLELDADYFFKKRLKLHWLRANEIFIDLVSALTQMLVDMRGDDCSDCDEKEKGTRIKDSCRGNISTSSSNNNDDSDSSVDEEDIDAPGGQSVLCASTASKRQVVSHFKKVSLLNGRGVESVKKKEKKKGTEEMSNKVDTVEDKGENGQQEGKYAKEWDLVETDPILDLIRNLRIMTKELSSPSAGEELAAAALQSAAIVFCTLTSAGSGLVKKNVYGVDVLVVDEAAQALEVELLIPLSASPKNLILVGDPKQLPACVLSMENQRTKRGESAMQRLMERCAYPSMLLDTQYRMHPAISMLPNRLFYEGRLFDSDHLIKRTNIFSAASRGQPHRALLSKDGSPATTASALPRWLQNYTFIDVPGTEVGGGQGGTSLSNSAEASAIVKLAAQLKELRGLDLRSQVCVITFYAGQVICINRTLKSSSIGKDGLRVMTVDSFQGSECDIVILSFVRSNARGSVGFVSNFQRLNVALTRAKHLLICVGCAKTLQKVTKKTGMNSQIEEGTQHLAEIIKDAKARNRVFLESSLLS